MVNVERNSPTASPPCLVNFPSKPFYKFSIKLNPKPTLKVVPKVA